LTLSTGLDALSQCIEAVANRNATPITTALATRGVGLVPDAIRRLKDSPDDLGARTAMAEAALLSGLAISHTRTGLAHSMSYPVTAHLRLPHGLACALHLPAVVAFIAEEDDGTLAALARSLGVGSAGALREWLLELYRDLGVADAVRAHVPDVEALRPYAAEMLDPARADNSLRPVREGDVARLLDDTAGWLDRVEAAS
jgi:alcohol dehydrogenase